MKNVLTVLLAAAVITGGALSWLASVHPDGLEWAMFKTSGKEELESHGAIHAFLSAFQEKTAFLPDYGFKKTEREFEPAVNPSWPAVDPGTSASGLLGGGLTFLMIVLIGWGLVRSYG